LAQSFIRLPVPFDVPDEFVGPPFSIGDGHGLVSGALVPETAVDEHSDLRSPKHKIGSSSHFWERCCVDKVSQASAMQLSAETEFFWRVASAGVSHSF
jgi:hypothetical protein